MEPSEEAAAAARSGRFPHHLPIVDARRTRSRATAVITAGRPPVKPDGPLNEPVVFASAYHAGGPVAYARDANPTWSALEDALGALEGGHALLFASGMAAIAAVLDGIPVGGRVVCPRDGYSGTRTLLRDVVPAGRFQTTFVEVADTDAVLTASEDAAVVWLESPTNPKNDVVDLPAVIDGAHARGARVVVDNTYATPMLQRPLELGADVVVHSVSKLLSGHSDLVLGAAVVPSTQDCDELRERRTFYGAIPGPMEAFLALRGLRTLALRVERAQANAEVLARRLAEHPAVEVVRYPGLETDPGHARAARQMDGPGSMVAFAVHGGADAAEAVARSVDLIVHATSLGGIETTMERRARWPGEEVTPPGLLRLSVGCEDVEDLWRDLAHALDIGAAVANAKPAKDWQ